MINTVLNHFISLSRPIKRLVMLTADFLVLLLALVLSFSLRLGEWYWPENEVVFLVLGAPFIAFPVFVYLGLYKAVIRYIGFKALWAVAQAVFLYMLLWGLLVLLSGVQGVPRSVILINGLVALFFIGGMRMMARWWIADVIVNHRSRRASDRNKSIVIYGAGNTGVQLATALSYGQDIYPVAFIDDDPSLSHQQTHGLTVYPFHELNDLIDQHRIKEVLLALPAITRHRRKEIMASLEPYPVKVRMIPSISELAEGRVRIEDLREVSIEDLLGREQVPPIEELLCANIANKTVMVTGAGGSIGAALCHQIAQLQPARLILFEQSEFHLYEIEQELSDLSIPGLETVAILGSVTEQERVEEVCRAFHVSTIYHAAAYKHVPMVEKNPRQAIRNNTFGTLNAALAADATGVETFVLISTDKAVRPTNIMGASKRIAELVLQALAERQDGAKRTKFTMVRFGNVLGSSGSVVPLFREQIKTGGPVTVTDKRIIRYFMTIPEAAELVIQAGAMGQGGDVFVLDMGEPVRILELARQMIRLSGLDVLDAEHPDGDIEIIFSGLRPGEKLYEELLIGDRVSSTQHKKILRAEEDVIPWSDLRPLLDQLEDAISSGDYEQIAGLLSRMVSGFKPQCKMVDAVQLSLQENLEAAT